MNEQSPTTIPLASTAAAVALTICSVLKPPRDADVGRELLIELAVVLALAAATFVVARRARPSGRAALTLAILGLVSVALFWLGLFSVVFAGGATLLALETRRRRPSPAATGALVLAAVTVALSVLIAVVA